MIDIIVTTTIGIFVGHKTLLTETHIMIFNSFQFLWLFPVIFLGYHLVMTISGGVRNTLGISGE